MTRLAPIMQGFFTDHLITQRHASPHTVASYRDTLTLLLGYAHQRSGKLPAQLDLGDLLRRMPERIWQTGPVFVDWISIDELHHQPPNARFVGTSCLTPHTLAGLTP